MGFCSLVWKVLSRRYLTRTPEGEWAYFTSVNILMHYLLSILYRLLIYFKSGLQQGGGIGNNRYFWDLGTVACSEISRELTRLT